MELSSERRVSFADDGIIAGGRTLGLLDRSQASPIVWTVGLSGRGISGSGCRRRLHPRVTGKSSDWLWRVGADRCDGVEHHAATIM